MTRLDGKIALIQYHIYNLMPRHLGSFDGLYASFPGQDFQDHVDLEFQKNQLFLHY